MGIFTSNPVFEMLKKDHAKVKEMFDQFEKATDRRTRARLVQETLLELEVHATLEEQLIYPAIREEIDAEDIMDEALEEHHVAHTLINELKRMSPSEDRYDAKFTVLGENIKHHVKEEENSMFPEAEKADLNWEELAQQAMERKEVLKARKGSSGKNGRSAKAKGGRKSRAPRLRKAA